MKGPFLAEKLQIRGGDTSSVTFGDSFPSRGSLRETPPRLNHHFFEGTVACEGRIRWPYFIQNSIESTLKGSFLAEKLQIRSSDTSSVTFGDSFPSRGSLRGRIIDTDIA